VARASALPEGQYFLCCDLCAVQGGLLWRCGLVQQVLQSLSPVAREQVPPVDVLRPQIARHLPDEHVVLDEAPARGVEERGLVGNRFRDDAIAGLGGDDIGGTYEILVPQTASVEPLFGDVEDSRRRLDLMCLRRNIGGGDGVPLEAAQRCGVQPFDSVAAERQQHQRLTARAGREPQDAAHVVGVAPRTAGDERDVGRLRVESAEAASHRQPEHLRRVPIAPADVFGKLRRGLFRVAFIDPVPREVADRD
jgi:hypothetical protein